MSEFDSWYGPKGTGSGVGSEVGYTTGYRAFLEKFMDDHEVQSVLDVGCGDWQFSKLVNWGDRIYVGVDEAALLVERLQFQYGKPTRLFYTYIPEADFDLVICKDVFIHLPNAEVVEMLDEFKKYKHALLTHHSEGDNPDCKRGGYRVIDLAKPPFSVPGENVYRFPVQHNANKIVFYRGPCA
jgi:SAM-dependent methyltransferase